MLKMIDKMIESQEQLNEIINPNWKIAEHQWNTAIIVEAGELIDSLDWKWWKKQDNDFNNAKVELIDILHFFISDLIVKNKTKIFKNTLFDIGNTVEPSPEPNKCILIERLKHFLTKYLNHRYKEATIEWFYCWSILGFTLQDILKEYLIKNTLNIFRQNHGYKNGTYKKIWVIDEYTLKEDNEVAFELADKLIQQYGFDDNFTDLLYRNLMEFYNGTF